MTNRRAFLKLGVAAATLPLTGHDVRAVFAATGELPETINPTSVIPRQIFIDSRYPESREFARTLMSLGDMAVPEQGDLAQRWYGHLLPVLKQQPQAFTGLTGMDSLFCLEMLSRDLHMRPVLMLEPPATASNGAQWGDDSSSVLAGSRWAVESAQFIGTASMRQLQTQRSVKAVHPRPRYQDRQGLVAWVIAPIRQV